MNATPKEESSVTAGRILKVFFNHSRKHFFSLAFIFVCILATSALEAIVPLFYKDFLDELIGSGATQVAFVALIWALSLKGLGWALWRPVTFLSSWIQTHVMAGLSNFAFASVLRHSYKFFTDSFIGSLTRKVNRFASAYETIFDQLTFNLIPILVKTVAMLFILFGRSTAIGVSVLVWFVVLLYFNYRALKWKQKYEEERAAADTKAGGALADSLTNNTTIKLFSSFTHEESLFSGVIESVRKIRLFTWNLNEIIRTVQGLLTVLVEVVVMVVSFKLYQQGLITIGDIVLFQTYILTLASSLWGLGWVLKALYQAFADAKEMVEIIDKPLDVQDIPNATTLSVAEGKIEFKDVVFNFNETREVFKNLSMTIAPGEKVAFVGSSGAGKTTITKLILRFYDVISGEIAIDGQNIAHVTQDSLRDAIALVPQEPILFHRSLLDNIRYGKQDATDEEVYEAAKKAHCHDFILALSDGYNTLVGERGVKLSGGERQRVAIARAILKNAPILILDEATSSLDSESESLIQDALKVLMEGKTVIVIAHRLSTIMKMDRILVVEDGSIRASGKHEELLKKDELYKKLWSIQVGGFLQ